VAVPSYRLNTSALSAILERSNATAIPGADVRVLLCVDNPRCPPAALDWLRQQQLSRLDGLRVHRHATNQARMVPHSSQRPHLSWH
jgi:hypothetical protein